MKRNASVAQNVLADLESAANKKGNGCLEGIIERAGILAPVDVYVWPSTDSVDAGLRRGVAYARGSLFMEDRYLVTFRGAPQLENCISLYDRMRATIHACLAEHSLKSAASRKLLNESAQVLMLEFAHKVWSDGEWQRLAENVDRQVRDLGCKSILPVSDVSECSDNAAHAADWALLAKIPSVGLGEMKARGGHLSLVKEGPRLAR
jgi:hypothetical protein